MQFVDQEADQRTSEEGLGEGEVEWQLSFPVLCLSAHFRDRSKTRDRACKSLLAIFKRNTTFNNRLKNGKWFPKKT